MQRQFALPPARTEGVVSRYQGITYQILILGHILQHYGMRQLINAFHSSLSNGLI